MRILGVLFLKQIVVQGRDEETGFVPILVEAVCKSIR
jgi:hypothetical protein